MMKNNISVGARVRYIANKCDNKWYPPRGTLGTVVRVHGENLIEVRWDSGTIDDSWFCYKSDVRVVEETNNDNEP